MFLYHSTFQLSNSVCLHLLCLLLVLLHSSSSRESKNVGNPANLSTQLHTTQTNCPTACVNGTQEVHSSPSPSFSVNNNSTSNKVTTVTSTEAENHSPTAFESIQEPVSTDHQFLTPQKVAEHALLPSKGTDSPTQAPRTGSITSPGTISSTTAQPVRNVYTTTVLVMSTIKTIPTPMPTTVTSAIATAATPQPPTTAKVTTMLINASTTLTITTTTDTSLSPPSKMVTVTSQPSTGMPPIQTPSLPTRPVSLSTSTSASHSESIAAVTRVTMVEVAGGALTRQLVDTASLLAVLLFGLLFFLVTVSVFITQAYESYRRKDYTQVDYLINGMYSDSSV